MTVMFGDCRQSMRSMAAVRIKVQMCVTSPPYFGLRDYGHEGQLGLEETPDEYVANLVEVFRLVRELLTDDGTLWLNLGDSYSVRHIGRRDHGTGAATSHLGPNKDGLPGGTEISASSNKLVPGLKPKNLIGIPWRVALALQADGWYLRQDIIWHKPNPMPESVKDRCTKAHEYLFLLSKAPRYYFDSEAIKEPLAESSKVRLAQDTAAQTGSARTHGGRRSNGNFKAVGGTTTNFRNKRSVWTIPPKPYKGAHFATFPPALVEPCILAGSRIGDTVFDPFFGSGTVGAVAKQLKRNWIGCELNKEYEPLQQARLNEIMI